MIFLERRILDSMQKEPKISIFFILIVHFLTPNRVDFRSTRLRLVLKSSNWLDFRLLFVSGGDNLLFSTLEA